MMRVRSNNLTPLVLLALACGAGVDEDRVTLLYAGREGLLVRGAGVELVGVAERGLVEGLTPGEALRLERVEGRVASVERAGEGTLPPGFAAGGHPLRGTILGVEGERLLVDHEAVEGVMDAMAMPFGASDAVRAWARPGDRIEARMIATGEGFWLVDVLRTGRAPAPVHFDAPVLTAGDVLPATTLGAAEGPAIRLGAGQGTPTVLTFLFTTCPDPAFCPALVARLQPLQAAMGERARIVSVTLDPERDTPAVLQAYARAVGAQPDRWRFAVPTTAELAKLAQQAGLTIHLETGRIVHSTRVLVLDAEGRLIERYDDVGFPLDRVLAQLGVDAAGEGG